jgi:hypothetical protein
VGSDGGTIGLIGSLVQASTLTSFLTSPWVTGPSPVSAGTAVPAPDIAGFFAQRESTASLEPPRCDDVYDLNALSAADQVAFFKTPIDPSLINDPEHDPAQWSLNADYGGDHTHLCTTNASITVHGTCIWMFDYGARFYKRLTVHGTGNANDALILVAGVSLASGLDAGEGIAFKAGLSSDVPIVFVSSGEVHVDHSLVEDTDTNVPYLSVFAGRCDLEAPKLGRSISLSHVSGSAQDLPGGVIGRLVQLGYLPNTASGTSGDFVPRAGTWREIKSSDGTY